MLSNVYIQKNDNKKKYWEEDKGNDKSNNCKENLELT